MDAAFIGNLETVRLLLAHGADPHRFDQNSETALHYAAWGGNADVARLLLAAGAHPGVISDVLYRSPLHTAAAWGNAELIELLLAADAPRDARDSDGATALLLATLARRTENVEALLAGGAEPDIADDDGITPLMMAARDGEVEAARLLLAAGADPDLRDRSGQGLNDYLNWHPEPVIVPEGSAVGSLGADPTPEELARLDAAHAEIRALISAR